MSGRRLALLRAVNVGGRNKVPMADLRALAEGLGYTDVSTYIASGNLLFTAADSDADLAQPLHAAIKERLNLKIDVVVVDAATLDRAANHHPFTDGDPKLVHVGFSNTQLTKTHLGRLEAVATASERLAIEGNLLFADFADGVAGSRLAGKLTNLFLPDFATLRNLATVRVLNQRLGG